MLVRMDSLPHALFYQVSLRISSSNDLHIEAKARQPAGMLFFQRNALDIATERCSSKPRTVFAVTDSTGCHVWLPVSFRHSGMPIAYEIQPTFVLATRVRWPHPPALTLLLRWMGVCMKHGSYGRGVWHKTLSLSPLDIVCRWRQPRSRVSLSICRGRLDSEHHASTGGGLVAKSAPLPDSRPRKSGRRLPDCLSGGASLSRD